MAPKPETKLVQKILLRLRAEGGKWSKIHGDPYQEAGISDILGCYKGRFIAIEVKCPGNTPSGLQKKYIADIVASKGYAGIAFTVQEALNIRDGKGGADYE